MRVSHAITRLIVGGAQENTVTSVLGLRARTGWDVDLISGPTDGPEGSIESRVASVPGLLTVVPHLVRPVRPAKDLAAFLSLRRLFASRRPDIVHTHSGKAGILGRLAAKAARVPVIVHTIHGPSFGPWQGGLSNSLFRTAERIAGRCTTHFVVVADAMAQQYLRAGIGKPRQYTRIFSGMDLAPFLTARNKPSLRRELGLDECDLVIGTIARLFRLKGHDDLFAVAPELVARFPRVRFLLVGDGIWRDRFERTVRRLGLGRHFIFAGLVEPARVPEYVGVMDVLAHLSRREGLPRALPQAMAAAKPVVAYDCDGAREVCLDGRTGFLIRPGDLKSLRTGLSTLLEDAELRERCGERGREYVRELFPADRMVNELARLYRKLALCE